VKVEASESSVETPHIVLGGVGPVRDSSELSRLFFCKPGCYILANLSCICDCSHCERNRSDSARSDASSGLSG